MARFRKGTYSPENPDKYVGGKAPVYRSSWELKFMQFLDLNDNVTAWASEAIDFPYVNPITGKPSKYVPDFIMSYEDKNGNSISEIVEVKPKRQAYIDEARSAADKAAVQVNQAKWRAAKEFCKSNKMRFRVITEDQIYTNPRTRKR